jgi:hypothetical protein
MKTWDSGMVRTVGNFGPGKGHPIVTAGWRQLPIAQTSENVLSYVASLDSVRKLQMSCGYFPDVAVLSM